MQYAESREEGELAVCNLECALLLARWVLAVGAIKPPDPPVTAEETTLLKMVRRMLDETEFAIPSSEATRQRNTAEGEEERPLGPSGHRKLASAVLRLWAEAFKGSHVYESVHVMGASLDGYAALLEDQSLVLLESTTGAGQSERGV